MSAVRRSVYRWYRRGKQWSLRHPGTTRARMFFRLLNLTEISIGIASRLLAKEADNVAWTECYRARFPHAPFVLEATQPIAIESHDHIWPRGAQNDSSKSKSFNSRCYSLLKQKSDIRLIDLGCAGGGLVRTILEDGHTAVGLEGSDIAQVMGKGEWPHCSKHLFTCDITKPFTLRSADGEQALFDVVTAWEVLEHIPENSLDSLADNIRRLLLPGGYFIASVDTSLYGNPLLGGGYHVTLKEKDWWLGLFRRFGFTEVVNHGFQKWEYLRGNGLGLKDWDPDDGEGFHLVLQYNGSRG